MGRNRKNNIEQQEEEKVENVPPPLSAEVMEEHDRVDREIFDTMPPGYRFVPTGEELIINYLKKKVLSLPLPHNRIRDVDIYKYHPQLLTSMYKLHRGKEWYFFTPRTKKYPNGQRPDRAAGNGFWKATGADFPIIDKQGIKIGTKMTLVYYIGKAKEKNAIKTDWIMHEYRVEDDNANNVDPVAKKDAKELDRWVLCKMYDKSSKEGGGVNNNQQVDNNMMIVPTNNGEHPNQNPNGAGSNIPVQNGQVQSPNTNQGWDGANFYNTSPFLMQNVNVQNANITDQGLDSGRFRNMASLPMHNILVQNPNIILGLDNGHFYDMPSGPTQNAQVPNSNITQGLQNERFYNMASIDPYDGVFENTASLHMQNDGPKNLNNMVGYPLSDFDQGKNIYSRNGPYFQSLGNDNQQGSSPDPLEMVKYQNQYQTFQPSDYQAMGMDSGVTHLLDYAPNYDHNLTLEDLQDEVPTEFPHYQAVLNHKDEESLDCKDGQLGGPDRTLSSIDKNG